LIPSRSKKCFSSPQCPDRLLSPTQTPNQWVSGSVSPRERWTERKDGNSLPSSAEIKNVGALSPLPHNSSWFVLNLSSARTIFQVGLCEVMVHEIILAFYVFKFDCSDHDHELSYTSHAKQTLIDKEAK
jgi:hypothetical protein